MADDDKDYVAIAVKALSKAFGKELTVNDIRNVEGPDNKIRIGIFAVFKHYIYFSIDNVEQAVEKGPEALAAWARLKVAFHNMMVSRDKASQAAMQRQLDLELKGTGWASKREH